MEKYDIENILLKWWDVNSIGQNLELERVEFKGYIGMYQKLLFDFIVASYGDVSPKNIIEKSKEGKMVYIMRNVNEIIKTDPDYAKEKYTIKCEEVCHDIEMKYNEMFEKESSKSK